MRQEPVGSSCWTRVSLPIGDVVFLSALAVSAFSVPRLRLLHVLQLMIYVADLVLTRQKSLWGVAMGSS